MDPHMTAYAEGNQSIWLVASVSMMNHQRRAGAARSAVATIARQHPLAHAAEKSQGMMAPIIASPAAIERFQLDRFLPARTKEGQLLP
jgi:hypothetical protein